MAWVQLTVEVAGTDIKAALQAFETLGSQATTQQNAGEDSYFDLAHPAEPGWDKQSITGLFETDGNGDQLVAGLMQLSGFIKDVELTRLQDQDWETLWLDQYQPIEITPDLWVYPSWVEPEHQGATIIKIDPGMAFGTGTHETTHGCMQVMSGLDLSHKTVLDYGCGSGILAIAALKLGADSAVGVDIDAKAERVSEENAHINGVSERFAIQSADRIKAQKFDVVVANILASALIELAPALIAHCEADGLIILSGILSRQADQVAATYRPTFDLKRFDQGDWVVLYGQRISPV